MQRGAPLQISPFMTLFAGLRTDKGGIVAVFKFALEHFAFVGQLGFEHQGSGHNNAQRQNKDAADDDGYLGNIFHSWSPLFRSPSPFSFMFSISNSRKPFVISAQRR